MKLPDDQRWVAACRAGDTAAYGTLVDRHYGQVFAICFGMLGNTHDAEDAAQEAFLRGFQQIGTLGEADLFPSWIARIAKHLCIDLMRKRQRGREAVADQAGLRQSKDDSDGDLADAIQRLPMELRTPLVMYYFGGRTAKGIAESLGISHSSACKRLRDAREALHRLLSGEGDSR